MRVSDRRDLTAPCDIDDVLFASLYRELRRFAAVVGPPDVDPDDLVQQALTCALAVGPLADLVDPSAYLRTAIVRLASNSRRSSRRRDRAHARVAGTLTAGRLDTYPSDRADLYRLSPADRGVVFLSVVERRSHREIAAMLAISEAAARKRLSRAIHRLRPASRPEDSDA